MVTVAVVVPVVAAVAGTVATKATDPDASTTIAQRPKSRWKPEIRRGAVEQWIFDMLAFLICV
ncbi:MAG: hypothetical protein ACJAR2_003542 [Ilumatobacter sp.]|jgi:hypothetical protein